QGAMPGAASSSSSGRSNATGALTSAGFGFAAADGALRDADAAGRRASIGGWTVPARSTTFGDSWTGSAWKATGDSMATEGSDAASDSAASNSIDSKMAGGSKMNGSSSRTGSSISIGDSACDCAIGASNAAGVSTDSEASSDAAASAWTSSKGGSVYVPNGSPSYRFRSLAGGVAEPNSLDRSSTGE